jgi:hypothetical protein
MLHTDGTKKKTGAESQIQVYRFNAIQTTVALSCGHTERYVRQAPVTLSIKGDIFMFL